MIAFGVELLALDAFARGRTRGAGAGAARAPVLGEQPSAVPVVADRPGAVRWPTWPGSATGAARAWSCWRSRRRSLLTFATPLGFAHRARAVAHGAVAGRVPRARGRIPSASGRCRTSSTLALATGIPAAWALWRTRRSTPLFELGRVAAVARAAAVGGARPDVLRRRQRGGVPALRAARARGAATRCCPPIGAVTRRVLRAAGSLHGDARRRRRLLPLDQAARGAGGTQPGLGRAIGGWAEAATDFLRARPAAGSDAEPRHGAGRRRHLLGPGRAGVRRFAAGIVPAGFPARRCWPRRRATPRWPG